MKIGKIRIIRYTIRILLLVLLVLGPLEIISFEGVFPCSFAIFGIEFTGPLGWIQRVLTTTSPLVSLFISSLFFIIATLLFGRFFCSWLCPIGLITETIHALKEKKITLGETDSHKKSGEATQSILLGRRRLMSYFKYSFLAAVLISSVLIKYPVFCLICPVGILSRNILGIFLLQRWTIGLIIPLAIFLSEIFLTDRVWCGSLCPIGALFSLLGSLPTKIFSLRVKKKPICEKCRRCWPKCPMGIIPSHYKIPDECSNCGLCKEICALEKVSSK